MGNITRLDRVWIFGDAISFLIPHEWIEGESGNDNNYLYHFPETESGWLRVSLITVKVLPENLSQRFDNIFGPERHATVEGQTGNRVCTWEKDSEEDGVPIHLYYWKVANVVPPDLIRKAVFSYTVLSGETDREETKEMVNLIGQLVSQAEFCPSA